jgi:hypothetical protein
MLTSLQIGSNGRLGNQMFQYAALLATAFVRGYDWKLQDNDNVELRKVFKMPNAKILLEEELSQLQFRYTDPSFDFSPGVFLSSDFTDLVGYFQSPLYFSDAFNYLKEDFDFIDDNSELVSGNSPEIDFCMMSLCDAHVIANSSFSWWAAALGNVEAVIAPAQWFGPKGPEKWQTIYAGGWVII